MEEKEKEEEEEGKSLGGLGRFQACVWDRDRERKRRVTGNNYPSLLFCLGEEPRFSLSKERRGEGGQIN